MNEFNFKLKNKFSDGSIDTEHYIAVFYCFVVVLPVLITWFGTVTLEHSSNAFLVLLELVVFTVISAFLFLLFGKKLFSYIIEKRFMLIFLSFPTVILFLLFTLSWFSFFWGNLVNLLSTSAYMTNQIPVVTHPEGDLIRSINSSRIVLQNMIIFSQILTISFLLNMFVPKSLQTVNVSFKKKFTRLGFKILCLTVTGLITFIFIITNKDNFSIVIFVYTAVMFFSAPKVIMYLFSDLKNIDDKTISDNVIRSFYFFQLILSELLIAWFISVYVFPTNITYRSHTLLTIFFILLIPTVIVRIFSMSKKADLFSKWIVDEEKEEKKDK